MMSGGTQFSMGRLGERGRGVPREDLPYQDIFDE